MDDFIAKQYTDVNINKILDFSQISYSLIVDLVTSLYDIIVYVSICHLFKRKKKERSKDLKVSCILVGIMAFISVFILFNFPGLADLIP